MKIKIKNAKIVTPPQPKQQGPEPQKGQPQEPQPPNVEEFDAKPPKGGKGGGEENEEKNQKPEDGQGEPQDDDSEEKENDKTSGSGEGEDSEEEKEGEDGGSGQKDKPQETKVKRVTVPKNPKPIKAPNEDEQYKPNTENGKTEEEKEKEMADKITKSYDQTMRENRGGSERGTGSGSGVGSMFKKDLYKTKTDWKTLLRNFVGGLPRVEQTWNRPASRYWTGMGQYMPSEKLVKDTLDLVVAIDTSASISSQQIHTFLNEVSTIVSATKRVKLKVLFWMDSVYSETDVDSKTMGLEAIRQKLQSIPIRNDGGTTLSSVKDYLSSKGIKKIEGLIYLTDGWTESNPQIPRVEKNRVIFMITPGGNLTTVSKLGIGRVVEVDIK
jgi:hypothetical protein